MMFNKTIAVTVMAISMGGAAVADTATNPHYVQYPEPTMIQRDLSSLDRVLRRNYSKFIAYATPNGGRILLVATDGMSDEQLLRAYNILDFYLTDVSGSRYGADKTAVANAMADNGAVLVMPGGSDGNSPILNRALVGQPLYALEFPTEGSRAYVTNDYEQRDAGFEEIFHMVHDTGIGTKYSQGVLNATYQAEISAAMSNGMRNNLWGRGDRDTQNWLAELGQEGSLEQEYIASVLDSYYGYWGAWTEAEGGMWGIYTAKTRDEVRRIDPMGAALVPQFLSDTVTYMARIDPGFSGTFEMNFNPSLPYTHKSQHLANARLLGDGASNLSGNNHDNILIGNAGDNRIDGNGGIDVVQYGFASTDVRIARSGNGITVFGPGIGTDTLLNIETLRFTDQDVAVSSL